MRAYFFGNFYLSSIQQGIQALHCTANMFVKYNKLPHNVCKDVVFDWADNFKTTILLNGGNSADLQELLDIFKDQDDFPWAYFNEDKDSLNSALTCIGIIIPESIYRTADFLRKGGKVSGEDSGFSTSCDNKYVLCKKDLLLINIINKCRMAG